MDYYQILGVSRGSSADEIKKAYRKLSKEWHPDKHSSTGQAGQVSKEAEEKYKEINRAYECLSDPKKKQMYDQFGSEDGPQCGGGGSGFSGYGNGFQSSGGFGDIFETFFGGAGGSRAREEHGRDAEVAVDISLEDAFRGTTKTIRLKKSVLCSVCGGSGDTKGSSKITCKTCDGTGQVVKRVQSFFGVIQQAMACSECRGSGRVSEKPCAACSGEGRVRGSEDVSVDVPKGIQEGQTLRIRGKGEAGRQGTAAGDLFVHIRIRKDAQFQRDGNDLRITHTISIVDAVLGTEESIPTFDGQMTLKIPAGTQPHQVLRVKGRGMPILSSSRMGDLYAMIDVEVPKKLDRRERKLWEDLRGGE